MLRLFSPWILATCLISLNLLFVMLAAMMGWLPGIFRFLHRALRGSLVWSYHLFRQLLTWIDPVLGERLGASVLVGSTRMAACTVLSLLLMGLLIWLTPLRATWWLYAFAGLHGLAVGYLWEDVFEPDGLHLGWMLQ